jgi:hypothetical protein
MDGTKNSEQIDHPRRDFVGAAAMTIAAAQFGLVGSAGAQPGKINCPRSSRGRTPRLLR